MEKESKKRKIEFYAKTTLLSRGWTERSIDELLPPPKLVDNPHYKCAAPMQLWDKKIVHQKERTKKFKMYAEKKAKRSKAMQKVIEKKKDETIEIAECLDITVKRIDFNELRKLALLDKEIWYEVTGQYWRAPLVHFADEATITRWELNYIRHNLTNYDEELEKLRGRIGKDIAYCHYKDILMDKIYEVYPEFMQEEEQA